MDYTEAEAGLHKAILVHVKSNAQQLQQEYEKLAGSAEEAVVQEEEGSSTQSATGGGTACGITQSSKKSVLLCLLCLLALCSGAFAGEAEIGHGEK